MRRILIAVLALFFVAAAVPRAHADNADRVSFFHSINVAEGDEAHDVVCILCSIHPDIAQDTALAHCPKFNRNHG